jgi:hypothetical protein
LMMAPNLKIRIPKNIRFKLPYQINHQGFNFGMSW